MIRSIKFAFLLLLVLITKTSYGQITLWCEGKADGRNTKQGQYQSPASTSIEFLDDTDYFVISDSSKIQIGAVFPYREVQIFKDMIFFKTSIDPIIGRGSFSGSVNRITGEMNTSFLAISKMGEIITVNGKLICNKKSDNKF